MSCFPKQANKVCQMNFLVSKTMPKAVEAIEGNFEFYPDKEKPLNFFRTKFLLLLVATN
jgi:hypothetical protein